MSSSIDLESASENSPKDISCIEHAGTLIHHVEANSSAVLQSFVSKCSREGRSIISSRPFPLPEKPAHRIDYFLTLSAQSVIEHFQPDQVISVEAGISISNLQKLLSEHKQWFPVYAHDEDMSLMEYINSGSSGPLEHAFGEARDLVLGMTVVLGTGEYIKCGGKVVKNVTGYDLPKLFAGSHGTLAIPYSAHLRLFALPETSITMVFDFASIGSALTVARKLRRSGLPLSCLELFSSNAFEVSTQVLPQNLNEISRGAHVSLAVEIHGSRSVVEELQKESMVLASDAVSSRIFNEADARVLWRFLAKPYAKLGSRWVGVSASLALIESILQGLKDSQSVAWTLRCGKNKGYIFSSGEILSEVEDLIKRISSSSNERVVVAHSGSAYTWKVRLLPEPDAVLDELKHRLKREFDPSGILNPLAEL